MAHRHKMQARARGGRTEFASGGVASGPKGGGIYAGEKGNVDDEARKKTTGPFKRGGAAVGKAFGGAVKGRADKRKRGGAVSRGFAAGGKVWSHAHGSIAGDKGMAAPVMTPKKLHDEMHDNTAKTAADGSNYRSGHGDKARHQYKDGGKVKAPAFAAGGRRKKHDDDDDDDDDDGDDDEDDRSGFSYGGVTTYKRGGSLKMHYVGGRGKRHKHAEGGVAEPDEDDRPRMEKGGGCWMAKAFAGSHGQFKAKAHKAGMSTAKYASKEADSPSASTKTKRQANLAKIGAKYGGG